MISDERRSPTGEPDTISWSSPSVMSIKLTKNRKLYMSMFGNCEETGYPKRTWLFFSVEKSFHRPCFFFFFFSWFIAQSVSINIHKCNNFSYQLPLYFQAVFRLKQVDFHRLMLSELTQKYRRTKSRTLIRLLLHS